MDLGIKNRVALIMASSSGLEVYSSTIPYGRRNSHDG